MSFRVTVLDQLLLPILTNDLLNKIGSEALVYADDAKIWRFMQNETNVSKPLKNLKTIEKYPVDNGFKHNLLECHVMNILTHLTQTINAFHGNPLLIGSSNRGLRHITTKSLDTSSNYIRIQSKRTQLSTL